MPLEEDKNQNNSIPEDPAVIVPADPLPPSDPTPNIPLAVEPPIAPPPMNFDEPSFPPPTDPQVQPDHQNTQTVPVSPLLQPSSPLPPSPDTAEKPLTSAQDQNPKGHLLGLVLSGFVTVLLITAIGGAYYFWLVPQAKAKEYISSVGTNIASINKNLAEVNSIFTQILDPLAKPEQSLNEITISRNYADAQKDTKQDIADIKKSLDLIKTADEQKEKIQIRSADIQELDNLVNEYFEKSQDALKTLLTHQEFQLKLLDAHGDMLEAELEKVDEVLKETDHKIIVSYFNSLSSLAKQSSEKMNSVTNVPHEEAEYFAVKKEYLDDIATTSDLLAKLFEEGTPKSDKTAAEAILSLSARNKERDIRISSYSQNYAEKSEARKKFDGSKDLYKKINEKIEELKVKYKVNLKIEDDNPKLETTASATPFSTASADATTSASSQASKSATFSANPINRAPK